MNALMSAHVAKTNAFTTWNYIDPDQLVTSKVEKVKIHAECPNKFWVEITKVTVCPNKYVICSEMFASEASNVTKKSILLPKINCFLSLFS